MNKKILIAGLVALALILGYYFYNKSQSGKADLPDTGPQDGFAADDTAAYEKAKGILTAQDPGALYWVNPYVLEAYKSNRPDYKIAGRISKVASFVKKVGELNETKDGKYTDKFNAKVRWPQDMFERLWNECLNPFAAKYGGI